MNNLANVSSIVSGLQQFRGIGRKMVGMLELLSAGPVFFLCNDKEESILYYFT